MSTETVSLIRPKAKNPATNPELSDALVAAVRAKRAVLRDALQTMVVEHGSEGRVVFANSFGAEDMVVTDVILREQLPIEIFSLDTGRLPIETYDLIAQVETRYQRHLTLYFPQSAAVEGLVREHGINPFYQSVELRKACCHVRKVEPLQRALHGKAAWITGMRAAQSTTRTDLPLRQFDDANGLVKYNPLSDWTEQEVWAAIRLDDIPYNALHDQFYPSIGCAPCTRSVAVGEDVRAGRWWWENPDSKECGLHAK